MTLILLARGRVVELGIMGHRRVETREVSVIHRVIQKDRIQLHSYTQYKKSGDFLIVGSLYES